MEVKRNPNPIYCFSPGSGAFATYSSMKTKARRNDPGASPTIITLGFANPGFRAGSARVLGHFGVGVPRAQFFGSFLKSTLGTRMLFVLACRCSYSNSNISAQMLASFRVL